MNPMRIFRSIILSIGLFSAASAPAWDLAVVGGFNYSHPSFNPDPPNGGTVTTEKAFDFGALLTAPLGGDYVVGTGLIRNSRDIVIDDPTTSVDTRYSGWLIPLTFRFMRAEFLGFGFGPYIAFLSSRTKSTTTFHSGGGSINIDGNDANRKSYEIGLSANLRLAYPVYHASKVILDGSYLFGVTDLNKSGTAEDKTQELLVLLGFQIPIGTELEAQQ